MNKPIRIAIVGGVAGGASAAARARRLDEQAAITVFERGPHVSFANCGLPYHIGGTIEERQRLLVQTPESLSARFDLDVRVRTEVLAIDRSAHSLLVRNLATGKEYRHEYDALVLSPGAEPLRPPIPGIEDPRIRTLRNLEDMDGILARLRQDTCRTVLVIGAGYIGLEMAEALVHRGHRLPHGLRVVLVEKLPQVMAVADPEMTAPLQEELERNGVDVRLGTSVERFFRDGEQLAASLSQGAAVLCDLAILAIGVRPDIRLARQAGLEIGSTGGIRVDAQMRTSDPAIWAVGDAVEVQDLVLGTPALIPLAGPANRQGRIAAEVILGRDSAYKHTQGTAVCKVFDLAFAMTGASERQLARSGRAYRRIYVHPADHATYYPGAHPLSLKLLFEPGSGRILGAQAVGKAGVDKRVDVLAMAIRGGMTVFDLEDAELCYAPPYGSAKDPVNMAGFVAANVLRGDVALWEPEELAGLTPDQLLVDVRTAQEFALGTIPGSRLAPVDELRDRLDDLPRDQELLVFCQVGLRGYVAARLLSQNGFRVRNLSGGYRRFLMWKGTGPAPLMACEPPLKREDGAPV
jgi:NADPH-dependent 2,4-dienoyl-CoA reductase/sulfur reductase-like enzyme/rhodanese-related sulfurtransferase